MGAKKNLFQGTAGIIFLVSIFAILILTLSAGLALYLKAYMEWAEVASFVGGFVTFLSILAFLASYLLNNRETKILAQREIYQRLELASIELFRFESNSMDTVILLWEGDEDEYEEKLPPLDIKKEYALKEYVCQILNLFEMALRFRRDGIMEEEVFGSWIIWMCELTTRPRFRKLWETDDGSLSKNYVSLLQDIFNGGVKAGRRLRSFKGNAYKQAFVDVIKEKRLCNDYANLPDFTRRIGVKA
jgi:hypothetical protein